MMIVPAEGFATLRRKEVIRGSDNRPAEQCRDTSPMRRGDCVNEKMAFENLIPVIGSIDERDFACRHERGT